MLGKKKGDKVTKPEKKKIPSQKASSKKVSSKKTAVKKGVAGKAPAARQNPSKKSFKEVLKKYIAGLKQKWAENPTTALTTAYVFALGLIACLTISMHFITASITEEQRVNAEMTYHIGRQRTLTQQIVFYANNYYQENERLDYDFMKQSLKELEAVHQIIATAVMPKTTFGFQGKPKSQVLFDIYFTDSFNLHKRIVEFDKLVLSYGALPPNDKSVGRDEERKKLLGEMGALVTNVLRPAMDAALEFYQAETLKKISFYYKVQLAGVFFILLVLLAEAIYIFRPLIGKVKNYTSEMEKFALEDALTGLNNRRAFMNTAITELKKSRREKTPLTVALLDLDHFKQVNDNYGHDVGDKVLQHFSEILKSSFRAGDVTGRIGGEEFAIVLPKIDAEGARVILQRLCDKTAQSPCPYTDENGQPAELSFTISVGYTGPQIFDDHHTVDSLLALADKGLYEAKEQGRNRVISVKEDSEFTESTEKEENVNKVVSQESAEEKTFEESDISAPAQPEKADIKPVAEDVQNTEDSGKKHDPAAPISSNPEASS